MIAGILAFFAALFVIVLIHELGHLAAAKWARMPVSVFSVGFGRKLWGIRLKGTEYRISLIPLGGYVRIDPMEETILGRHGPMSRFDTYPWLQRAIVISAGVGMNMLLALSLYLAIPAIWGITPPPQAKVAGIDETDAADVASWRALPTDVRVVSFGGREVRDMQELLITVVGAAPGVQEAVLEDGSRVSLTIPDDENERMALVTALRPSHEPIVGDVVPGTPAEHAGFRSLDRIVSAAGEPVTSWEAWQRRVDASPGAEIPVVVERGGEHVSITLTPRAQMNASGVLVGAAGLSRGAIRTRAGLDGGLRYAVTSFGRTVDVIKESWTILFRGRISVRQVSGPVQVVGTTVRVFKNGWEPFLAFVAFLSVNIAIVNLLPIPALDGGYLGLMGLELVRRRPLTAPVQAYLGRVGMIWLCLIMAGTLVNDILKLAGQ